MYVGSVARKHPDKPAYVMAGSGETVTYRELDERSNRLAQLFADRGLRPGDAIALCMENNARYFEVTWAAQRSGLYYSAISSRLTQDELAYIVGDCGAKAFVTSTYKAPQAQALLETTPNVTSRLMVGGTGTDTDGYESYERAVAAYPPTPLAQELEGADLLYSSGTTGRPKGVKVELPGTAAGDGMNELLALTTMLYGLSADAVYLSPAPLYHAAPLRFCMAAMRLGATVVVMERFDAEQFLALIERYSVTHTQVVPTMFVRLLKLPEEVRRRYDVSSLQTVVHAAAPCPVPVKKAIIDWLGPVVHEYYAGTEGNGFVACTSEEWLAHEGTVGRPLLGELHIRDEQGNDLPPGQPGQIWMKGPRDFAYHNDPDKTASAHSADGASTLGDIGYLDEDGYLYLTDRKSYMIIRGGVNIYPQETENLLVTHAKVLDVAVFGIPDEELGQRVQAVVQPVDMADAGPQLAEELSAFCREHLAGYKCPAAIDFDAELPRHPTGKLYKRLLVDRYAARV